MTRREPGIPTTYRGTRFRSRLEARWAAFFDAIGWRWEYEPFDTDGYVPDFAILGARPVLVEVKPALSLNELAPHVGRAGRASREILLVGASQTLPEPTRQADETLGPFSINTPIAGILLQDLEQEHAGTGGAHWHRCTAPACDRIAVHHTWGSYRSYPCGHYDGDRYLGPVAHEALEHAWAGARNQTQWKRR